MLFSTHVDNNDNNTANMLETDEKTQYEIPINSFKYLLGCRLLKSSLYLQENGFKGLFKINVQDIII